MCEPLVFEQHAELESLADCAFECSEFGPEVEALEDAAGLGRTSGFEPRDRPEPDVERDAGNEGGGTDISGVIASLQPALH